MYRLLLLLLITSCGLSPVKKTPIEPVVINVGKSFNYKSSISWFKDLSEKSNCVVNLKGFQDELSSIEKFDFTDESGKDVLNKLLSRTGTLRSYKTKNPFSKTIATTYSSNNRDIYLNLRKNPRKMKYMVNTACHEHTHLSGFSHNGNSRIGKENSAPYFVGALCEKHYKECEDGRNNLR